MDIGVEVDELPIGVEVDRVCRTCLASEDTLEPLEGQNEHDTLSLLKILELTFGKIIHLQTDLPNSVCSECQEIIRKSYEFKKKVDQSTNVLMEKDGDGSFLGSFGLEDKDTQTDFSEFNTLKAAELVRDEVIQFDEENFDTINLQLESEDYPNPLMVQMTADVEEEERVELRINTEDTCANDYESTGNEDGGLSSSDTNHPSILIMNEENENLVCDINLFKGGEDSNQEKFKIHKCDKCNKSFSRATHLKRHKLTHSEGKIQCTICDKKFTRLDHLNHHQASNHSESKPFQCLVLDCKKGFVKQEHLKKHIEAKHGDPAKEKECCEICHKTFSSKKYLRMHLKAHNEGKGLSCKYCSQEFSDKSELSEHLSKDHQNEKPYLCSECGLRFVRNDYLVIHMRRHMGVKPYKCKFCDKGFPRATDLTVHERYHTNEKTHLCNLCGKGFQRAYNLLVHMRVHTGEKPYQCSFCNKSFSQGNDLKAHIRRHTGERFKCDLCNEGFIQGYHLTHHKRTVHGLDVKSHIRRVEKFVASTSMNLDEEKQLPDETDHIKREAEQNFVVEQVRLLKIA